MKTWHAFAFLIVTAIVMYYVKCPILIIAGMIGFFWGGPWRLIIGIVLISSIPKKIPRWPASFAESASLTSPRTSPKELLQKQMGAMSAISVATHKLQAAAPNARDYQTAQPDAFATAMNDHLDRVKRPQSVMNELDAIAQYIVNSVSNGAG